MIGISIGDTLLAAHRESAKILKKAKGDPSKVIDHVLSEMYARRILSADDKKKLEVCYADTLGVLAGKKSPEKTRVATHKRYLLMVANRNCTPGARVLADHCQTIIEKAATVFDGQLQGDSEEAVSRKALDRLEREVAAAVGGSLLGAFIGESIGGSVGGPIGFIVGAIIGAFIGGCLDDADDEEDDG